MAYIYRLITLLLLFSFASSSFALIPKSTNYRYNRSPITSDYIYSTTAAACSAFLVTFTNTANTYTIASQIATACFVKSVRKSDGYTETISASLQALVSCPVNSTVSGDFCACTLPMIENLAKTACEMPPDANAKICADYAAANTVGQDVEFPGIVSDGPTCMATPGVTGGKGCSADFERFLTWSRQGVSRSGGTVFRRAGSSPCTIPVAGGTPAPAEPLKCPTGQQIGQVNGVDTCVPFDRATTTATEKVKTTTGTDAAGKPISTTEKSTTTCVGGKCSTETTTTTTGTGADGLPTTTTKTDTTAESKSDYCTKNPKTPECGGSEDNSFSGSCGSGFKCEGDALQCAMANEQYETNCKLYGEDKDSNSEYNKAISGNDESDIEKLKDQAEKVDIVKLDKSGLGWSNSCPADPVISLNFGRPSSFSIPFSRICGPLGALSVAGVGITLLGAMLWVLGSKKS